VSDSLTLGLTFIVPLRNRAVARDWSRVSALCNDTLGSTLNQDHPNHRTLLVCKELPEGYEDHPKLIAIQEEFAEPSNKTEQLEDKYRKIQRGLIEARRMLSGGGATHIMVVDADDLVSNRLAGVIAADPSQAGWICESGYYFREGSRTVIRHPQGFHLYCGSSAIVRSTAADLPLTMDQPKRSFPLLGYGHHQIAEHMSKAGTPLLPLKFPGAIYRVETGENWSGFAFDRVKSRRFALRRWLNTRPLTQRIRDEFHLR
jgi:hypothetical protein